MKGFWPFSRPRFHGANPVPQDICARCEKKAPGARGGRVAIESPKQQFTYSFVFCEPCMDELHAKLGDVIGDFCQSSPRLKLNAS